MSSSFNPSFELQWQLSQAADKIEIFVMEPELYAIVIPTNRDTQRETFTSIPHCSTYSSTRLAFV